MFNQLFLLLFQIFKPSDSNCIILYSKCLHILNDLHKHNNKYFFSFFKYFFSEGTFCSDKDFLVVLFTTIKNWLYSLNSSINEVISYAVPFVDKCLSFTLIDEHVFTSFFTMLNAYFILIHSNETKDNSVVSSLPNLFDKSIVYFRAQMEKAPTELVGYITSTFLYVFANETFARSYLDVDCEIFVSLLTLIENEVLNGFNVKKYNLEHLENLILLRMILQFAQLRKYDYKNKQFNKNINVSYFMHEFTEKYMLAYKNENSTILYIMKVIEKLVSDKLFNGITFNTIMCENIHYLLIFIQTLIENKDKKTQRKTLETSKEYINDLHQYYTIYNKIINHLTYKKDNIDLCDFLLSDSVKDFADFYSLIAEKENIKCNDDSFYLNLHDIMNALINKQSNPFVFEFINIFYNNDDKKIIPYAHANKIHELVISFVNYYFLQIIPDIHVITNKYQLRNMINVLWMFYTIAHNDKYFIILFQINSENKKQKNLFFYLKTLILFMKKVGFFYSKVCINKVLLIEALFDLLMRLIILCNKDSSLNLYVSECINLIEKVFQFNKHFQLFNYLNPQLSNKEPDVYIDMDNIENDICIDCEKIYNLNFQLMFLIKLSIYYQTLKDDSCPKNKTFVDKYIHYWCKNLCNCILDEDKKCKGTYITKSLDLIEDIQIKQMLLEWTNQWKIEKGVASWNISNKLLNLLKPYFNNICMNIINKNKIVVDNLRDLEKFERYSKTVYISSSNKQDIINKNTLYKHKVLILVPPKKKTYRQLLKNKVAYKYGITFYEDDTTFQIQTINNEIKQSSSNDNEINELSNYNYNSMSTTFKPNKKFESVYDMKYNDILHSPKHDLLKTTFALNFIDYYFNNENFIKLKNSFLSLYEVNILSKQILFPSKQKNFSNNYEPNLFLTFNSSFFNDKSYQVTHPYFQYNKHASHLLPDITFIKKAFVFERRKFSNISYPCELISITSIIEGKIYISEECLYFNSLYSDKGNNQRRHNIEYVFASPENEIINKKKKLYLPIKDIYEIITKRFLLMDQAFEIKMKNGKSYFFNCYSHYLLKTLLKHLRNFNCLKNKILNTRKIFPQLKLDKKWQKGKISSYQYILLLNKFSSRSFNDVNQYYIFPWVLKQYSTFFKVKIHSHKTNTTSNEQKGSFIEHLRDFKYPVCVQTTKGKERASAKYESSKYNNDDPNKKGWCYHIGSHYSTSGFILYYNMRQYPFTSELVKFQSNSQENSNRMFISLSETQSVIHSILDSRELIPEFFSSIEFMLNLNCAFFGYKVTGELVDDVILPENETLISFHSFNDYIDFIRKHRLILNNSSLANHLVMWINNIFGEGQFYESENKNKNSFNLFSKTSYEELTNLQRKLEKYKKIEPYNEDEILSKLEGKIVQILSFGQTPIRLYKTPHINKKGEVNLMDNEFFEMGIQMNSTRNNKIEKMNVNDTVIYFMINDTNTRCLVLNSSKSIIIYNIYEEVQKQKHKDKDKVLNQKITYNIEGNDNLSENENDANKMKNIENDISQSKSKNIFNELFSFNTKNKFSFLCEIPPSNMKLFKHHSEYKYNPKYIIIALYNFTHIITCRHKLHLLHIYTLPPNSTSSSKPSLNIISLNHFPYSLCKLTETKFLCGLSTGQLLLFKHNSLKPSTYEPSITFHDHTSPIITIDLHKRLNIIITSSISGHIHIRKSFDFELLTVIYFNNNILIPLQTVVTVCNCIYVLYSDITSTNKCNKIIYGYTLNGLFFGKSGYGSYVGLEGNEDGDVYTGLEEQFGLCCIKGSLKNKVRKFALGLLKVKEGRNEWEKRKLKWFEYYIKGNKRFLYIVDDGGELQQIERYWLKEFEFFK